MKIIVPFMELLGIAKNNVFRKGEEGNGSSWDEFNKNYRSPFENSIKGRADEHILQFPMVTTNSISIDTVEILRNQLELERSYEFITVFTNTANLKDDGDNTFLSDYHTNVNLESMNKNEITNSNERLLQTLEEKVNHFSLNDKTISNSYRDENKILSEKDDVKEEEEGRGKGPKIVPSRSKFSPNMAEKENSSIPTFISTNVKWKTSNELREITFGIKTVLHPVESLDVIYYLSDTTRRAQFLVNLVKFTTGELRFFRDIVLNVDKSKKIAKDMRKHRGGKVWQSLNNIYSIDFLARLSNKLGKKIIPTTSLVISIDEVNEIKRTAGIDILNDKRASSAVYDKMFLLELIVVDEINDMIYKYHGKRRMFDTHKLSRLGGNKVKDSDKKKGISNEEFVKLLRG